MCHLFVNPKVPAKVSRLVCVGDGCCGNVAILVSVIVREGQYMGPEMGDGSHNIMKSKHSCTKLWGGRGFFFIFLQGKVQASSGEQDKRMDRFDNECPVLVKTAKICSHLFSLCKQNILHFWQDYLSKCLKM